MQDPISTDNTPKPTSYRTPFIVTILVAVALLATLIVSVFLWINSSNSQKNEIAHLNHLLETQPPSQDCTTEDKVTDNINERPNQSSPYIDNNFLYVPEWSVKFQLSDHLTDYGYAVAQDSLSASYGSYQIGLTAFQRSDLVSRPQAQYYDDIFSCAMVTISKTDEDVSNLHGPRAIIPYNNSHFIIYDYSGKTYCDINHDDKTQVIDQLVEIFSHPLAI